MTDDDDRRALERAVAGVPVSADDLADALTQRAFDRTVVVEALLLGLDDPDPATRWEIARRTARLVDLDPLVGARLAVMTDQDVDERVREAAADGLRAHGLTVPGEDSGPQAAPARGRTLGAVLRLRLAGDRAEGGLELVSELAESEGLSGVLSADGAGGAVLALDGLPDALIGRVLLLRVASEANGPRFPIATAAQPVTEDGGVVFRVPADVVPFYELIERMADGVDLAVPEGG